MNLHQTAGKPVILGNGTIFELAQFPDYSAYLGSEVIRELQIYLEENSPTL
jgi:hypothetical protein